jgi:hypothetical protein
MQSTSSGAGRLSPRRATADWRPSLRFVRVVRRGGRACGARADAMYWSLTTMTTVVDVEDHRAGSEIRRVILHVNGATPLRLERLLRAGLAVAWRHRNPGGPLQRMSASTVRPALHHQRRSPSRRRLLRPPGSGSARAHLTTAAPRSRDAEVPSCKLGLRVHRVNFVAVFLYEVEPASAEVSRPSTARMANGRASSRAATATREPSSGAAPIAIW